MQIKHLFITITTLFSLLLPNFTHAQVKRLMPDANLAAAVRQEIGNSITTRTLLNLKRLDVPNRGIRDLTGLEHAHNLTELNLGGEYVEAERKYLNSNTISDFSSIAGLTQLTRLNLSYCSLTDVSFLSSLTQLTRLHLNKNNISDISPIANLTQLTNLYLSHNDISDISPLSGLLQLTRLHISGTTISDISVLTNLTQLQYLYLWTNNISDISPLSRLTQLKTLDLSGNDIIDVSPLVGLDLPGTERDSTGLDITWNLLSYASVNTHIPTMQAKGVTIKFDDRTPTTLVKLSETAQQGTVNTALPLPFVVEVQDEKYRPFAGVPVTFAITDGGGRLKTTTTKTDATGRAVTYLTLGRVVGTTTIQATAVEISQSVPFTATATLSSSPVRIPDPNLRAKIAETLRMPLSETLTAADLLKLTTLNANNANILDLTGLQYASNLKSLSLANNSVSNLAPLVGLTQLTTLNLKNNWLSDVSPLIYAIQFNGSKDLRRLYLQGNPLSDTSIQTHIPKLQAAGVNVRFDSALTQPGRVVRLIYFRPRDRQPRSDINMQMDRLIKEVHQFYAREMEKHGYGRKNFTFETDAHGNAVVYHINGKFDDTYYHKYSNIVWNEVNEHFDRSEYIYLTALDISTEIIGRGEDRNVCGIAFGVNHFGDALIPASGNCFSLSTAAHELGHTFGLHHDFRDGTYLMSYGPGQDTLSQCAAQWLDVHRAFNARPVSSNEWATIEMLPLTLASPPNAFRLRFKVTDPDGLHQAQLHTETISGIAEGQPELLTYKRLNGNANRTVELVTNLGPKNETVTLQVIDMEGNFTESQSFPVNVASLLPRSKVVSIPDPNLAAAIQEEIGDPITTHTLLHLTRLKLGNRGITDLTGLEHAHNLRTLNLDGTVRRIGQSSKSNAILDFSPLVGLTQLTELNLSRNRIADVSTLEALTQLTHLDLSDNNISNIPILEGVPQLTYLNLSNNNISDLSVLDGLTQLTELHLSGNNLSNISLLTGMTQLTSLSLSNNNLSNISPLAGMTQLTSLSLSYNNLSNISPLAGMTQLTYLSLSNNNISDLSALEGLTQLTHLFLESNNISDVAPLVGLDLLGTSGDSTGLYLYRNPLSYASINTHIPAMIAKGVRVRFVRLIPTTLVKISGDVQQGTVNAALPLPFVVEVRDHRNNAFAGVPVTFSVTAGGGTVSTKTTTTDAIGRAETRLTLGKTAGTATVRVIVAGTQPVQFNATAVSLSAPVAITDVALRAAIMAALNKPRGATPNREDMLKLTTLTANNANIHNLMGLQQSPNLKTLSLENNNISDVELLAELSQLTSLSLNGNNISDFAPLNALTQLRTLSLENNNISDVTDLVQMVQLRTLSLENNNISDVAPLESLTQLKTLYLRGNPLNFASLHTHIPAIQVNGTVVRVDPRTPTTLVKVSGTHGVIDTILPVIVEVQDEQGLGFAGVPVKFTVTAGDGHLSAANVITDATGVARTSLTLGSSPGKNTVRVTAPEVRQPALFTITAVNAYSPVTVPDANLRAKVAETLGKPASAQLRAGDMLRLTKLEARNSGIKDLTGLEHAHNLRELNLAAEYVKAERRNFNNNKISDFAPIAGLTQLSQLDLSYCSLSDVSFLSNLTRLTRLRLYYNTISDISPLAGLTQLTFLELSDNDISDVSPLAGLTQLNALYLFTTAISDISALSSLTELRDLGISSTPVLDVSPLAGLTQLNYLYLGWIAVSDISPLAGLIQLTSLSLPGNSITDVSALSGLTQLEQLDLRSNAILDVSPLGGLELPGTRWNSIGLYIENNPLNYASVYTHIPAMQSKGIEVQFDNRAHSAFVKISGDTQEDAADATLPIPFAVKAMDPHGVPITGLFVRFYVSEGEGRLSATTVTTDANGRAETTLTLGPDMGVNKVGVTALQITYPVTFTAIATETARLAADVNSDGNVNIQDLVLVSANFGQTGENSADVNGDGKVNIADLVLVAGAFGGAAAAPAMHPSMLAKLSRTDIRRWLDEAKQLGETDVVYLRGITVLEQLLIALIPKETLLFVNYPNPFNPETWIPYQLATPSEVTLHIYTVNGVLVRTLVLGHQPAGRYHSKSRAAYWDGRNAQGERVASGIYFYTLSAGDFAATRKMLIRK